MSGKTVNEITRGDVKSEPSTEWILGAQTPSSYAGGMSRSIGCFNAPQAPTFGLLQTPSTDR